MPRAAEPRRHLSLLDVVRRGRGRAEWVLLFLAAVALAAGLLAARLTAPVDGLIYDALIRQTPRAPDPRILIVGIDDATLRDLGRWPWTRRAHAALIDRLREAGAICYDVLFVEPSPDDLALSKSLSANGHVALPLLIESPGANGTPYSVVAPVVPSAGTGHVTVRTDSDGIYRRVTLVERIGDAHWPHLAMTTLKTAGLVVTETGALIPFTGPAGHYPTISFSKVMRGEVPPDLLRGKIIFVGATAAGLGDRYATPAENSNDLMSGIEVQANIADALLHGGLRSEVGLAGAIGFAAVPLGLLWFGFLRFTPRANLVLAGALIILTVVAAGVLLVCGGYWVRPAAALVTILFMFPLWGWRRLSAVSAYLSNEIARLGSDTDASVLPARGGDMLERQIAHLEAAGERMRMLRTQRDATLGFLSHDMRSPASSILTLLGMAPKSAREKRIAEHAQRALRLAEQFVQSARAEEAPLALERIDLSIAVEEAADLCWEAAQRARSRIEVAAPNVALTVGADPSLLSRALTNLIDNALKYSSASSVICLRAWRAGDRAIISVADQGAGMNAEQVEHLFQPFERAGLADDRGVGLGLALVATAARRHKGSVICISRPGIGTVFVLDLPILA